MILELHDQIHACVPSRPGREIYLEADSVFLITWLAGRVEDAHGNAAMQACPAALALTVILVFSHVVELQFPVVFVFSPIPSQLAMLLPP